MPAESTIDLDRDAAATEHLPFRQLLRRRYPTRRLAGAGAVTIAVVALAVSSAIGGTSLPAAPPSPAQTVAAQHARLIAPAAATPGQRIIVLAYRNQNLCGPAELRLDGKPVHQQKLTDAGPDPYTYRQLFIAMDLPPSATPGRHRIDLLGPVRSRTGDLCGDHPEHQARIDSTVISITADNS